MLNSKIQVFKFVSRETFENSFTHDTLLDALVLAVKRFRGESASLLKILKKTTAEGVDTQIKFWIFTKQKFNSQCLEIV